LIEFACKEYTSVLESTVAIYNGKIVDTGAKELPLIHVYMNSNLIFDLSKIIVTKHHIN
jgi:hypothetical protein